MTLETDPRRFPRLYPGMRRFSYHERLDRLSLYSLEFRIIQGDLIHTYKILRALDRVGVEMRSLTGES